MKAHAPRSSPARNRFVRSLSPTARKAFLADCERVDLEEAEHVVDPGMPLQHVYFPESALLSQIAVSPRTSPVEVTLTGDEGMVGATFALGVQVSPLLVIVQGSGEALRMTAKSFVDHLQRNAKLDALVRRYLYVQIDQMGRTCACMRYHVVEQRLARWLLKLQDRVHTDTFHMTQKYLAAMLGVRRVGVTQAAILLQDQGIISYSRGNIVVRDRAALEQASCPCYFADAEVYAAFMGP